MEGSVSLLVFLPSLPYLNAEISLGWDIFFSVFFKLSLLCRCSRDKRVSSHVIHPGAVRRQITPSKLFKLILILIQEHNKKMDTTFLLARRNNLLSSSKSSTEAQWHGWSLKILQRLHHHQRPNPDSSIRSCHTRTCIR